LLTLFSSRIKGADTFRTFAMGLFIFSNRALARGI
jgi:hypothetical protein